jgi:hypothetical protein
LQEIFAEAYSQAFRSEPPVNVFSFLFDLDEGDLPPKVEPVPYDVPEELHRPFTKDYNPKEFIKRIIKRPQKWSDIAAFVANFIDTMVKPSAEYHDR